MTAIPNRLRQERKKQGLTLHELAEKIDKSTTLVWSWEKGEREILFPDLVRISEVLGIPITKLDPNCRELLKVFSDSDILSEVNRRMKGE